MNFTDDVSHGMLHHRLEINVKKGINTALYNSVMQSLVAHAPLQHFSKIFGAWISPVPMLKHQHTGPNKEKVSSVILWERKIARSLLHLLIYLLF